jgi:adenylate cyclase
MVGLKRGHDIPDKDRPMKLRTFLLFFFLFSVALTIANHFIASGLKKIVVETESTQADLQKLTSVSQELLYSNQTSTRLARAYVSTGNQAMRDHYQALMDILAGKIRRPDGYNNTYWDRVAGKLTEAPKRITEGAKSIEDYFLGLGINNAEFNKLKEAKTQIFDLSRAENAAMDLAKDFHTKTPTKKNSKADNRQATELVNNLDYEQANGRVAELLSEFDSMVRTRHLDRLHALNEKSEQLTSYTLVLSFLLYATILLSVLYLYFWIEKRAISAIRTLHDISDGNLQARTDVKGSDEIGRLAQLVNWAGDNLQTTVSALKEKVEKNEGLVGDLKKERDRSEKLLHNILPAAIAERLSSGESTIAEVFPEVTVLFSDIVGFTELSASIGPSETVRLLNDLFGAFDELADKHSVEKIKTIGDCYMVVGGVPNRDSLHCQHIAEFALDALSYVQRMSNQLPFPVKIRIGIHTGTVAAGVVGKKRFSYDLWGDVVNVASRYESTGEPNKIHVSEAVKFRLADDFTFSDGGEVNLKGKGTVRSFFLIQRGRAPVIPFEKHRRARSGSE